MLCCGVVWCGWVWCVWCVWVSCGVYGCGVGVFLVWTQSTFHLQPFSDATSLYGAFAYGNGSILLSSLSCHGDERSLLDCAYDTPDLYVCDHFQDVNIACKREPPSPPPSLVLDLPFSPPPPPPPPPSISVPIPSSSNTGIDHY